MMNGFPEQFVSRVKGQGYLDADGLLSSLEGSPVTSVRINPKKFRGIEEATLPSLRISAEIPWCSAGRYLEERPIFTLDPLYHAGCYYPQEASSMFIEQVFRQLVDTNEKLKVLDLCAAPGGKSTHIASLLGDDSLFVANEVIRQRVSVLNETITKWGIPNCMITCNDPSSFSGLNGYFDVILVDAPCSGEGMFRDPKVRDEWSLNNTALCAERQRRILSDVWPALKQGGLLIYSTCTFNPSENEGNVSWLLESLGGESVPLNISDYDGVVEVSLGDAICYSLQPGRVAGDGFFLSVVKKVRDEKSVMVKQGKRAVVGQPSQEVKKRALSWLRPVDRQLIQKGSDVILLPCSAADYCFLSERLRVVKSGTVVLTEKGSSLLPSHELAMSVLYNGLSFPTIDFDKRSALEYMKRDPVYVPEKPNGWLMVRYNCMNVGFVNNIGNRFNNYYPVEWRIRMQIR